MATDLKTCVVIGGRGFVGRSLVLRLLKLGHWIVKIADSEDSLQLDPSERNSLLADALSNGSASYFRLDVRDKPQIVTAIEGSSVVFYVESTTSNMHDFYSCYTVIVQGTKNIINSCRECKVKRLIYNSTADVIFDGTHDVINGDECLPYALKFYDLLTDLKAQAEALVLLANDLDGLLTCAIRPSNIFGPGDTTIIPFLVNHAKTGWSKFIIGSGENMHDFTFVENVAHALICAEEALGSHMVSVSGKAFFITNLDPIEFWEFVSLVLEGLGYQRPMIKLPAYLVQHVVSLAKAIHDSTNANQSISVHNIVSLALCSRTFKCYAAQNHLGYSPVVSLEDGISLTLKSFSHLSRDSVSASESELDEQSKADKLLGSGKVADILLWRDEKQTFACFLVVFLLYYWFFFCGRTFISCAAETLLLISIVLYGTRMLPPNGFGSSTVERLSASSFEISIMHVKKVIETFAHIWNRMVLIARELYEGEDWNLFFKAALLSYIFKLSLSSSLPAAVGAGVVLPFMVFFIYEQYEVEIDGISMILVAVGKPAIGLLLSNLPSTVSAFLGNGYLAGKDL